MTETRDISVGELAVMLADDVERVAEALNLDIRRRSPRKLYCASPSDPKRIKLEIELRPVRGKWNDWAAGRYGDALGLVAFALGFPDPKAKEALRQAIVWTKHFYGIDSAGFDREAWARRRADAERRAKDREAKAARELTAARKTANGLWLAAQELTPDTAGWAYLAERRIDLDQLPRRPRAVRFSPAQDWFDEDGEVRHIGPALMSAMTLADGRFGSLHRIWIDPARPGQKADLSHISDRAAVRKMWPSSEGAAIRLWRGETGLSEKEAGQRGIIEDMIVCEGVEDGLSIALMTPELRIAAAGSLPGLLSFVPPKHVRRVIVAADNDWGKDQAQAMLTRACRRLVEDFGKQVSIARSPTGKDFNDQLKGA